MRALIFVLVTCSATYCSAEELRWGFATADGMPYVDVVDQQLRGGVIYQLGQQASQRLGLTVHFVETPNKRIEEFMQRGHIHVICNNNPQWMAEPLRYHWSPPLYEEEDVLLQHRQQPPIDSLEDLYGKVLGTQLGYVYNVPLMAAFANHQVTRRDVRDLRTSLNLLKKQRLDAIIDMRRPINFQLAKGPDAPLQFSPWVIQRYEMHCTYGPTLPVSAERLDKVLQELRDQGSISQMLDNI